MIKKPNIFVVICVICLMVMGSGNKLFGAKIKIMPLGDSITGTTCYPPFLWEDLMSNGDTNVVYVGTIITNGGQGVTCAGKAYYQPTEGHSGWSSSNIADSLPSWLSKTNPDIVYMHVGTNNFWNGATTSDIVGTLNDYTKIVNAMRANNANMKIIVAQIIPMDYTAATLAATNTLDDSIPSWAAAHTTAQSPIYVVDLRTGFDMTNYYADAPSNVHPNSAGSKWMADKMFPVLATVLGTVTGTVDTTAPSVSVTSPSNGATVTGTTTVSATASDNTGVIGVQFKLNGANLGSEDVVSPYSYAWNSTSTANGTYTLSAVARDAAGNTKTSSISVTVSNIADTTSPTVSINAPSNGATVSGTTTISATASDNTGVIGVQFKLNSANLGSEDVVSPYSYAWNSISTANGTYTLSAVARDAAGNTKTSSISVTVSNIADTTAPTVSITAPTSGATLSGTVSVTASASDNVGVAGVQFKLNGANLGSEVTSSPYSYSWNTTSAANGTYTLSATARDGAGNTTTSSITVTVSNVVQPASSFLVAASDNFNRADQLPVTGAKWGRLLNQPAKGAMRVVSQTIQAYDSAGVGYGGGTVWDSLVTKGSGVTLTVSQRAADNTYTSLFIYARMNNKDLNTGNGYRFRYVDNASGSATLAIQKVTSGTNGTDLVTTTHQVNIGDTLKFIVQDDASGTLTAYVNSTQVLSVADTTYNPTSWYYWVRGMVLSTLPTFDNFTLLTKVPAALPIQLSSFAAVSSGPAVVNLNWTTTSEVNNYGFYIERRSLTDTTFRAVSSFIPGAGTSLEEHLYSFADSTVTVGTYYYRLKQIDLSGEYVYSSTIVVNVTGVLGVKDNFKPMAFQLMQNYPNPFNPSTVIQYELPANGRVFLKIYDMLGQEVSTLVDGEQSVGQHEVSFNASRLSSGVYLYKITAGKYSDVKKMLLVR